MFNTSKTIVIFISIKCSPQNSGSQEMGLDTIDNNANFLRKKWNNFGNNENVKNPKVL